VAGAADDAGMAPGTGGAWKFWVWPRYENHVRIWCVTLVATSAAPAFGTITADDTADVTDWSLDGNLTMGTGDPVAPRLFRLHQIGSASSTPAETVIGIDNDSNSTASVIVQNIACYEVPRVEADSTYGVDLPTVKANTPIYESGTAGDDASIQGVAKVARAAKTVARKNKIFDWSLEGGHTGVTSTGTWVTVHTGLLPTGMCRLLETGVTVRACGWNCRAKVTGGDQTGEVRITMGTGDTDTITVTSTGFAWQTEGSIDIETEDPTRWDTDGGIRGGTRDTITIEIRVTGTTTSIELRSVSVGEAT